MTDLSYYYTDEEWNETPKQREARFLAERRKANNPEKPVPKGTCPKCLKHIGKGIHFHIKACKK